MSHAAVHSLAESLCTESEMYANSSNCAIRHQKYGPHWLQPQRCYIFLSLKLSQRERKFEVVAQFTTDNVTTLATMLIFVLLSLL